MAPLLPAADQYYSHRARSSIADPRAGPRNMASRAALWHGGGASNLFSGAASSVSAAGSSFGAEIMAMTDRLAGWSDAPPGLTCA